MAESVLAERQHEIESLTLVPGGGGEFEVVVDGHLIYSKKQTGQHTSPEEILGLLAKESST